MKLAVIGQNSRMLAKLLEQRGTELCAPAEAELLIPYGGDGTMLGAEREYPGIRPLRTPRTQAMPPATKHRPTKPFELNKLSAIGYVRL